MSDAESVAAATTPVRPSESHLEQPELLAVAARVLLSGVDWRDLQIWWARTISLRRPTLEVLARRFQITRARAQQIEVKSSRRIRRSLAGLASGPIALAALDLTQKLGTAYPISELRLPLLGLDSGIGDGDRPITHPIIGSDVGELLLYLAGPYRIDGGWLVRSDYSRDDEVRLATTSENGDPVELEVVVDRLVQSGVLLSVAERLLRDAHGLKIIEGLVCHWPSDTTSRAALVLRLAGQPLTKREIARRVEKQFGTVGNALAASPQFVRLDVDSYGLTEWGGERYDGIVDEMKDAIRRHGGIATVDQIIADVTGRYTVSPKSVRAYIASHQFVRVGPGLYRIRGSAEAVASNTRARLEETSSCFVIRSDWALRLDVNAERLRGSGTSVPSAFSFHVGVAPAGKLEVAVESRSNSKRLGHVRFGWPKNVPTIGSVADVITLLDLQRGDYLFLAWDSERERLIANGTTPDGDAQLSESGTRSQIAALIGLDEAPDSTPEVLRSLAKALGLDEDAGRGSVIGRLTTRGDRDLIKLSRILYDLVAIRVDSRSPLR